MIYFNDWNIYYKTFMIAYDTLVKLKNKSEREADIYNLKGI